jgi:hypothetical protein
MLLTEAKMTYILDLTLESIIHDVLLDVHRDEKMARMQTAVIELEDRLNDKLPQARPEAEPSQSQEPAATEAATMTSTGIQLKGNPMKTIHHIRCPNCRLRRLLYPRVGFNSRPVPDPTEQYCKQEPMIILDQHDVHGQRKKDVKAKGQVKAKSKMKNKNDLDSPTSHYSDPLTPSSSMADSVYFNVIEYPAAKCPNRDSHLGDHWKPVNRMAQHLNGGCYLKRDQAAGREPNENVDDTPQDGQISAARAITPVKRKAEDEVAIPVVKMMKMMKKKNKKKKKKTKKKRKMQKVQKPRDVKKGGKGAVGVRSKLRDSVTNVEEKAER